MACNCGTSEYIEKLYVEFGQKKAELKPTTFKGTVKKGFNLFFTGICMIFIYPFLFGYVVYKRYSKNNKISLRKFFNLKEYSNNEQQQDIQN